VDDEIKDGAKIGTVNLGQNTTAEQYNTYVATPKLDLNVINNLPQGKYKFENGQLGSY
jgi:hypothetical protein